MPNDPFPLPSQENQPMAQEVKLTDEVAPILTAPPIPASIPPIAGKPLPIVTLLLLLISVGAVAASYFFYQQTKSLNLQLSQITKTLEQQAIKENQTTITPTMSISPTPTSTISAQIPITPTPTSSLNKGTGPVWGVIDDVMAAAQKQYPNSQLVLVKAENVGDAAQTIKYWFRQNVSDRKYLYLLKETGKDLSLVDQNVTIFETNLLPSLNPYFTSGQLGLDLSEAVSIATAACPATFDCVNTTITGQYVKSGVTLWQISYKPSNNGQPFVVQIDSVSKKILYKSL